MLGLYPGAVPEDVLAGTQRHDDLFERAITGALADSVDGAFDLPCPGLYGGDGVGYSQTEIVVAMH